MKNAAVWGFLFLSSMSQAQGLSEFDRFDSHSDIKKIKIRVTSASISESAPELALQKINQELLPVGADQMEGAGPLEIVDMLLKIWDIVEKNRPVLKINTPNITALPKIANQSWSRLTGWLPERVVGFNIEATNGFGMSPVSMNYNVRLLAGGTVDGKGKYIASAGVFPKSINVGWGYSLDVEVSVRSIQNVGTAKNPLAAVTVDVTANISTILKDSSMSQSFLLRGDGMIQDLDTGKKYFDGSLKNVSDEVQCQECSTRELYF